MFALWALCANWVEVVTTYVHCDLVFFEYVQSTTWALWQKQAFCRKHLAQLGNKSCESSCIVSFHFLNHFSLLGVTNVLQLTLTYSIKKNKIIKQHQCRQLRIKFEGYANTANHSLLHFDTLTKEWIEQMARALILYLIYSHQNVSVTTADSGQRPGLCCCWCCTIPNDRLSLRKEMHSSVTLLFKHSYRKVLSHLGIIFKKNYVFQSMVLTKYLVIGICT